MSMAKCETCKHYKPEPIVKMEGICTDTTKDIFVADTKSNPEIKVFDFSWCINHETSNYRHIRKP